MALTKTHNRMIQNAAINVVDFGADPTGTADSQSAIQAAIDTGKPVYVPTGKYKVSSTLKLNNNGQKFFGDGQAYGEKDVGSVLIWTGTSGNFFEINSGRRDQGNINLFVKGVQLQDIQLFQEANGSAVCENMLWVENGCFDCKVDNISIWIEGLVPTQAAMRIGSDNTSYVNGCHFSRIYIRPSNLDSTAAAPVPKGLWVLGAIESSFSEISVYDVQNAYVLGGTSSEYRNLESCTFEKLHCEVGDRDYATLNGAALEFWAGSDLTFYGCKFQMPTSDSTTGFENFRGIQFLGNNQDILERIKFISCRFGGNQNADYAIVDQSDGRFVSAYFTDCTFAEFSEGIVDAPFPATSQMMFNNLEIYRARSDINRNLTFAARGYESGALNITAKSADNYTLTNFPSWSRRALYLGSVTHPASQPVLFTGVQYIAGAYNFEANLFNAGTSTAITSADNVVRVRPIDDSEIISQTIKAYASGAIGDGAVYNESVHVPGVIVGDHVVCGYIDDRATGAGSTVLNGLILSAQVTANNTVDFQILNETGVSRTPPTGRMIVAKVGMQFDIVHVENYDAPSISDGAYLINDVTVTGAKVGDYVSVAPLTNTQNIFLSAAIKADNTVSLVFYNDTGGAIDLAAINYVIGIIHQPEYA